MQKLVQKISYTYEVIASLDLTATAFSVFVLTLGAELAETDFAEEGDAKEVTVSEEEGERWTGAAEVDGVSIGSPGRIGTTLERVAAEEERETLDGTALDSEMTENDEDIL